MNNIGFQKLFAMFPQALSIKSLELDVNKISNFCYELKSADTIGKIKSNRGGWQSENFNLSLIENLELNKLFHMIDVAINEVSHEMGIIPKLGISNMWVNINQHGNYNIPHFHPGSILSGVFYVKAPENCGTINFENPIAPLVESYLEYSNLNNDNDINYTDWISRKCWIPCKDNTLVIFPSWIRHFVEENLNNTEDRIAIAFNAERIYES